MSHWSAFLLVFAGGGLGSVCRYALGLLILPWLPRFPLATLAANALACFLLGWLIAWQLLGQLSDARRLLLATGFCGGCSTFSTFTAETWHLWQSGQSAAAAANLFLNLAVSALCLILGMKM
jgi:CrcB protein